MTKRNPNKPSSEKTVRDIRRAIRRQYSADEKIRIVLDGLRGEDSVAELCRREGINSNVYYRWSKEFLEAGEKRLAGDTAREATTTEVKDLRSESAALKEAVAELLMENRLLKKSVTGDGADDMKDILPQRSTKSFAWWSSPACQSNRRWPAWILMEAGDKFQYPTTRVNEMWQTDFTYCKIIGWGWYYLSTILDDYSRFILAWRLCTTMAASDVSDTLDDALSFTGLDQVKVKHQAAPALRHWPLVHCQRPGGLPR
jgi:transposase